ncbi:PLP-dependent aminotransferase family protein [Pseudomonas weihenstephanensis]|uniref:aminotransferase-like domain-containing protein n=1 Tax=Pseudomonas weihenstephanensis TaxID=1608994 RepID=UPI0006535364|nr:PLP-dependent aminotransferase family protein [Pseudomonas weihenstephanensis]KMN16966.1 GntR family transcriptional regulator [Pseudomonas weihenstephanensis]
MHIPTLEFQPGTPKVQQIVDALSAAIDQGLLSPGSKLPSARQMTEAFGVSKFTLIEALDRLRGQNRITSSQGLGYFVALAPTQSRAAGVDLLPQDLTSVLRRSLIGASLAMRPGAGHLPEHWLQPSSLRASLRQISRSAQLRLTGYGDPAGYLPLRQALQQKLASQGLDVPVEQIITSSNTIQALDMLLRLRLRPGDTVLLDAPCYFNFHANLALHGAQVVTLERTAQGLDLQALETLLIEQRPSVYLTTSVLHNPTGHSFSPSQAYGILELAKRYGCHIIEDDLYGDLHPDPPLRLSTLAGPEHVTYLSGFSKTLSANFRVSYVVTTAQQAASLTHMKLMCGGITCEMLEQLVCSTLNDGSYHKHRKRVLRDLLSSGARVAAWLHGLGMTLSQPYEGGLFIWATLPAGLDADALAHTALQQGMVLAPGTLFGYAPSRQRQLRFNVAHTDDPQVMAAVEALLISAG